MLQPRTVICSSGRSSAKRAGGDQHLGIRLLDSDSVPVARGNYANGDGDRVKRWDLLGNLVAGARNGQYLEFPWTIAEIAPDKPTATTRV